MTTIYRDDVTGEEHRTDTNLHESGIYVEGATFDCLDTVEADDIEHVDAVADRLHDMVDEWAEDREEYIKQEGSA